jgi:nicotinamide mononucleotide transporter
MLQLSWTEAIGSLTGLVSVWLTVRGNVWCWFWGIVSVLVYAVVFFDARLYADMALQLVFVVMNVYGWYEWLRGGAQHKKRRISVISQAELLVSVISGGIAGVALSIFLKRFTNAAVPEMDAALTALSLVAVWMQAQKYRESWLVWLFADVLYVGLFFNRQLWLTSALYLVFCIMAVLGWREWNHQMQKENALEHR